MQVQKTVFISYRRTNIYMARAVYGNLRANGYETFLDYQSLSSGDFSQNLLSQIAAHAHFVVVLTPSALERCISPDDWMRREIEYAVQQKRNIIPLMFEGFKFEEVGQYLVSDELKMLQRYNGLNIHDDYFEEAMDRLCSKRYLDRDIDTILHPVGAQAAQAARAAQAKVDGEPEPTAEQLEAERFFESGFRKLRFLYDFDGAIEDFTQVINLRPDNAEAYYRRGKLRSSIGDKIGAIQDLRQAEKFMIDDNRINIIRSTIAWEQGNLKLALKEADVCIEQNPNFDEAYFWRGHIYADLGEYDKAIDDYDVAIRIYPLAESLINRAAAHQANGNYRKAITDYNQAIKMHPHGAAAYNNRGNIYHAQGKFDKALVDYNNAIRINPRYAEAYINRGNLWDDKGEFDKALADYNDAIRLNPKLAQAYYNRGFALAAKGNHSAAIADYSAVIHLDPYHIDALLGRGIEHRANGNLNESIKDFITVLDIDPQNAIAKQALELLRRGSIKKVYTSQEPKSAD